MDNELMVIVNESGLEKTKADFILQKFQDYFKLASEWEARAKTIVVTSDDQKPEMDMARVGRLFLREKRIAIEKTRKELKEQSLREGKAIDGIANVLKALIEPIEQYLDCQENFTKYRLRMEEAERLRKQKEQEEREAIEKEQARIKAEKEEQERIRIENEKLKQEAIEKEKQLKIEREKAEKEKAEIERLNKIEMEKQEAILKAANDKLEAERQERLRLQAEEETKRVKEQLRIEAEKQKELEAQKAPDKEKLKVFILVLQDIKYPDITNNDLKISLELCKKNIQGAIQILNNKLGG